MASKPNLKRKEPVRFEPLTGERRKKLLQDIAPKEKGKANKGVQRRKEEDEKTIKQTKEFLEKLR